LQYVESLFQREIPTLYKTPREGALLLFQKLGLKIQVATQLPVHVGLRDRPQRRRKPEFSTRLLFISSLQ
jgi:hypothetical protein